MLRYASYTFGNPLWCTDDKLSELKGTTLHLDAANEARSLGNLAFNTCVVSEIWLQVWNKLSTVPGILSLRFRDDQLIRFLKRKVWRQLTPHCIKEATVYKSSPEELFRKNSEKGQKAVYLFTQTQRKSKNRNGSQLNRIVQDKGFWKATAGDRPIPNVGEKIGLKKTLVFYSGKNKTNWIMHEYRLVKEEQSDDNWVICKIHRHNYKSSRRQEDQEYGNMDSIVTSSSSNSNSGYPPQVFQSSTDPSLYNTSAPLPLGNHDTVPDMVPSPNNGYPPCDFQLQMESSSGFGFEEGANYDQVQEDSASNPNNGYPLCDFQLPMDPALYNNTTTSTSGFGFEEGANFDQVQEDSASNPNNGYPPCDFQLQMDPALYNKTTTSSASGFGFEEGASYDQVQEDSVSNPNNGYPSCDFQLQMDPPLYYTTTSSSGFETEEEIANELDDDDRAYLQQFYNI